MSKSSLSTGNVCVNRIASRKLMRDILPNHGEYYRGAREQKDRHRFVDFVQSPTAMALHDSLNNTVGLYGLKMYNIHLLEEQYE